MVLESITRPLSSEEHPWRLFALGLLYATVGVFLALWVFSQYASLVMVFFTAFAAFPLMYRTLFLEEKQDTILPDELRILSQHRKALFFFIVLFVGVSVAFTFWYSVLPTETATTVFRAQAESINALNQHVTGRIPTGGIPVFTKIFLNNMRVLIFSMMFSFIYGCGAIFIMMWNASVIGAAAGNLTKTTLAKLSGAAGLGTIGAYASVTGLSIIRYATHGIPEILAYFIAGLAGGILSVAIIKGDLWNQNSERIVLDVSDLALIAVVTLFAAGIIEVFVTPIAVQAFTNMFISV